MAKNIYRIVSNTQRTPQSMPIPGKDMAQNNAGGHTFKLDKFKMLERFLILGTIGGNFYVNETKYTQDAIECIGLCLREDYKKTIDMIVDVSQNGRAHKNDHAIFALSLACAFMEKDEVRQYASKRLSQVCRIGTHLFQFVDFEKGMRPFGRSLRTAVTNWYNEKNAVWQVAKYANREGWSHKDVLRVAHPKAKDNMTQALFRYIAKDEWSPMLDETILKPIKGLREMKESNPAYVAQVVEAHGLTWEMIPTEYRNDPTVMRALLLNMPMTALIRNLGNLSASGVLSAADFDTVNYVVDKIVDEEQLKKARVHPIVIMNALLTYKSGHGFRGHNSWKPVPQVLDALEEAFYKAFDYIESTGKRFYLGVDVSGSMSWSGDGITTNAQRAAAMAMTIARKERNYVIRGFCHSMADLGITANTNLAQAFESVQRMNFGATDCALPMLDALQKAEKYDAFVVITDNETWHGDIHPYQALNKYRRETGIDAKLIVIAMTSTGFSIADPDDPGMLDVVGFDTGVPAVISEFVK